MKRQAFKRLTDERLSDAKFLFNAGRWPASYYFAGYSVECALKASILAKFDREQIGNEIVFMKNSKENYLQHDFGKLLQFAGLKAVLESIEVEVKSAVGNEHTDKHGLLTNWSIVSSWKVDHRYDTDISEIAARELLEAIEHSSQGVLPWIKNYW